MSKTLNTNIQQQITTAHKLGSPSNDLKGMKSKAAMFGLDARIALAIFGVLSIITGAVLYSAIEKTRLTTLLVEFETIVKATEQHYLDTGEKLTQFDSDSINASSLFSNAFSIPNWNGPYLEDLNIDELPIFPETAIFTTYLQKSSSWPGNINRNICPIPTHINRADCAEWLVVYVPDASDIPKMEKIFIKLDKMVDNSDGELSGKVRFSRNTEHPTALGWIMYKSIPHARSI